VIITIVIFLKENTSYGDKRGISGNCELELWIGISKDRGSHKSSLEGIEGKLLSFISNERNIFLGEIDKGT